MIFLAIFFCPRDLVYKLVQLKLVTFVICIYNEILRANKIYKGLEEGKSAMPAEGSVFFIPVLIAILKVNSYPIFRKFLKIKTKINFDNFFSGQWIYTCHSNHSIDQRRWLATTKFGSCHTVTNFQIMFFVGIRFSFGAKFGNFISCFCIIIHCCGIIWNWCL